MSLFSWLATNPLIGSSAIGSLGNLIGGTTNALVQRKINQDNIAFQREINDTNYQRQLDMWNATNEYNSPAAQMQRYQAAGLNPNLIYGQSNTAQMASVGNAQAQQKVAPNFDFLGQFMNQIIDGFMKQKDFDYRKEEISQKQVENFILDNTKDAQIEVTKNQAEMISKQLQIIGFQIADRDLDRAIKETKNLMDKLNYDYQQMNYDYDKVFKDMGLPPDLPPQYAVLFSMLGSFVHAITGKTLNFKELASTLGQEMQSLLGTKFK